MEHPSSLRQSPVALLVGVVALVALLTWLVGWALPLVIFLIIAMVMAHEFGHFITAKRAGMLVTDFFVGFGPVLWSTQRGETRYGVRALLLGGYVKVPGMAWSVPVDPAIESRTYREASYPKKVIFASAGSFMHGVMALALAWGALAFIGAPSTSHVGVQAFSVWQGHAETVAQQAGMKVGDQIVSIDGHTITNYAQPATLIHHSVGKELTIVVDRNGKDLTLHATPVSGTTLKVAGKSLPAGGYIGIELSELTVRSSLLGAVPGAFAEIGSLLSAAAHNIVHVFSPAEFSSLFHQVTSPAAATNVKNQYTRPVSILGVTRLAVQGANSGVGPLLAILIEVNIFVGVLNMLPILPVDGGYVAVATYERLRSRRGVRHHADVNKLAPIIYAFVGVLLFLFATTLYLDIAHPLPNPFG
ncbi:MAG TPA: site-2 protease family protein [Acidimicrobiales bacterium]|nr:site-2 protease family protein [Acidimicrobiales bacterium]